MKAEELKKAYQKMSRQLKKEGFNHKCVMTARQQELGTATICFGYVIDSEGVVKEFGTVEQQREKNRQEFEKLKKAKPLKDFCTMANATIGMEKKNEGRIEFWYLRFTY